MSNEWTQYIEALEEAGAKVVIVDWSRNVGGERGNNNTEVVNDENNGEREGEGSGCYSITIKGG